MTVSDHLEEALRELREAQDEAGIGTRLMVGELIDDLEDLKGRYERINDDV